MPAKRKSNAQSSGKTKRSSSSRPRLKQHESFGDGPPPKATVPVKRIGPKPLRIIGGSLKRKKVMYNGDLQTRPMKDSVRENIFNIIGKAIEGAVAWDLFAGTGIIAMESISRGAESAIAIDIARECSRLIRNAAESLGIESKVECLTGDTFRLAPTRLKYSEGQRRVVFCCPPYRFWETKQELLNQLLVNAMENAAVGSLIIAETDGKFDTSKLPPADWDVRIYGNTRVAVMEVT